MKTFNDSSDEDRNKGSMCLTLNRFKNLQESPSLFYSIPDTMVGALLYKHGINHFTSDLLNTFYMALAYQYCVNGGDVNVCETPLKFGKKTGKDGRIKRGTKPCGKCEACELRLNLDHIAR